jgi:cell fate regulator YaaT (PSP1 superfamily)
LTDFRSVNTSAARYQQLSLNPQKLAAMRKMLCLNYELDTYMDALKGFPDFETKLVTEKEMQFVKTIFSKINGLPTLIILLTGILKIEKYRKSSPKTN